MTTSLTPDAAARPAAPETPAAIAKVSIIISKGSLEGIYPGLIMANGARMDGIEANVFFTFFGMDAITKEKQRKMEALDIPPIEEFVQMIADSGGRIYACKASVDMFGLAREDFVDSLADIITVGEFYEMAAGGEIIFTRPIGARRHDTPARMIPAGVSCRTTPEAGLEPATR